MISPLPQFVLKLFSAPNPMLDTKMGRVEGLDDLCKTVGLFYGEHSQYDGALCFLSQAKEYECHVVLSFC